VEHTDIIIQKETLALCQASVKKKRWTGKLEGAEEDDGAGGGEAASFGFDADANGFGAGEAGAEGDKLGIAFREGEEADTLRRVAGDAPDLISLVGGECGEVFDQKEGFVTAGGGYEGGGGVGGGVGAVKGGDGSAGGDGGEEGLLVGELV